ncbi:hypothetical protein L1987_36182 [Smallanthus sonchifolius]|uniref:Uncharacterized protein n=1 Tax=Smallanthus sonchifolius TaxID=185202 RepID=A0ACB9HE30_9ASTR|nr:hypothetical protein L1987_36182 [Smallanthus sonchifolius]
MDIEEPIYCGDNTGNSGGDMPYVFELYFFFLFIIFILCYISYICNRNMRSSLPVPPTSGGVDYHFIRLPEGLLDDVLDTFPTFPYSRTVMPDAETDNSTTDGYGSGCSICLADYTPADMLRLLPECGHLFHVSCIDTWLKIHPTCPVCRNSFDFTN